MEKKIKALIEAEREVAKKDLVWLFFWMVILLTIGLYLGVMKRSMPKDAEGFSEFSDQGSAVG